MGVFFFFFFMIWDYDGWCLFGCLKVDSFCHSLGNFWTSYESPLPILVEECVYLGKNEFGF